MKRKFESGTKILKEELLNGFYPKDVEYIFCVVYKNLEPDISTLMP